MTVLSDRWIKNMAKKEKMIRPFIAKQKRKGKISFERAKFSLCPCEEKIWWIEADKVDLDTQKNNISFITFCI